jgi:transaldolase
MMIPKERAMNATKELHEAGQSLWLDNITRDLVRSGELQRYIEEYAITGLTSNPTIFDKAIGEGAAYDESIRQKTRQGITGERLFFELAIEDLTAATDLFLPIHQSTGGLDGWASLEVSPLLAYDTASTIQEAKDLWARAKRENLFIKIPGTPEGNPAIEESIFAGVPINVTLLFSREQYLASAEAYMRGVERRIAAGLDPVVPSVASIFISRWDVAIKDQVPEALRNRLGIAIAQRSYKAYRELLASERWQKLAAAGAQRQTLLWASTGTKDPNASDVLYIEALAAPETINTIPESTLLAFANHGVVGAMMDPNGSDAERMLAEFTRAGVDIDALALKLQQDGAAAFVKSWHELLRQIEAKAAALNQAV